MAVDPLIPSDYKNIYDTGETFLQSDANTGKIFGGTFSERMKAKSLRDPGSGPGGNIGAGAIAGMAGQVFGMFDKDKNKYGNADILGDVASGVAQGAMFGPIGMAFMGGKALIEGIGKKKEQRRIDKQIHHSKLRDAKDQSIRKENHASAAEFFKKQKTATAGAYGIKDIDAFLGKYSSPNQLV